MRKSLREQMRPLGPTEPDPPSPTGGEGLIQDLDRRATLIWAVFITPMPMRIGQREDVHSSSKNRSIAEPILSDSARTLAVTGWWARLRPRLAGWLREGRRRRPFRGGGPTGRIAEHRCPSGS
jgi:hypothetical protein